MSKNKAHDFPAFCFSTKYLIAISSGSILFTSMLSSENLKKT